MGGGGGAKEVDRASLRPDFRSWCLVLFIDMH